MVIGGGSARQLRGAAWGRSIALLPDTLRGMGASMGPRGGSLLLSVRVCACVCECVCQRERKKEKEGEREGKRERKREIGQ